MGWTDWFSGTSSSSSDGDASKPKDSFSHLDPEIRAFLEKEAPIKPSQADSRGLPKPTTSSSSSSSSSSSQFDPSAYSAYGNKYADLWAQYRPPAIVEAEARTPSIAVGDVYASFAQRRGTVGRAAMENCVFEHDALTKCYGSNLLGSWTGCSKELQKMERCFMAQQEFLKTLGYGAGGMQEGEEERMQVHADRLYREQERREKEVVEEVEKRQKERKRAGKEEQEKEEN